MLAALPLLWLAMGLLAVVSIGSSFALWMAASLMLVGFTLPALSRDWDWRRPRVLAGTWMMWSGLAAMLDEFANRAGAVALGLGITIAVIVAWTVLLAALHRQSGTATGQTRTQP